MIEAAGKEWPEYAFWLTTGISDPDYGHVAPGSAGFPVSSTRKENSAALFDRWLSLKATALSAAPLLELVDNLLKKVDGPSKAKLASILKRERTMVDRNNALDNAKDLDGMIAAMKDHDPYKE